jgi:hypothetical protein
MSLPAVWVRPIAVLLLTLTPALARAQGGPPLLTDDPDTPGPNHWEINVSAFLARTHLQRTLELPRVDLNYGVGEHIQLKFELPWVNVRPADELSQSGAGNAVLGVKWRFLGHEGTTVAWSIYPQFEFNTARSSVLKGAVDEGRRLILPTELTVEVSRIEINGEIGRTFIENAPTNWIYGISTEGAVSHRLELLAELHGEKNPDAITELIANIGARHKLTSQLTAMGAVGRAVRGSDDERARLLLYVGLQFNLPGRYSFETAARRSASTWPPSGAATRSGVRR